MSKRCPSCGVINSDDRYFCTECDGPLDANAKLIMDLEARSKPRQERPAPVRDDDDDYIPPIARKKKKKSAVPWVILALVVVAVILWIVLRW